ncbi:MAG TPA: hypothetical protein VLJ42_12000 [Solirubrobacteraceae bacterium]|nr:hypothetical protein [Solirubrobacteraceae bacterium]
MSALNPAGAARLIVVCHSDPTGRYEWLGRALPGDTLVSLDTMAHVDLLARGSRSFDELESWEQRDTAEHRIAELMSAVGTHPTVGAISHRGHRLIDFAAYRLRIELVRLLRGWTLGCAGAHAGARELLADPAAPAALLIGARAALGLDPALVPYTLPPALAGSRWRRAVARPLMRALAARSRPQRVQVAAVATGKLALALASLSHADLRATGLGVMPFPGLDHGNSALLALRRGLPLLSTQGPRRAGPGPAVRLPRRLGLDESPLLDRALTVLVEQLLAGAAPELDCAVAALAGLSAAPALRALLLPSAAYGSSRLLIEWAHARGVSVGAAQHGIYAHRQFDGGDRLADVVFGWGAGTVEQTRGWPHPRPLVLPVGVPGLAVAAVRRAGSRDAPAAGLRRAGSRDAPAPRLRRALIATSSSLDTPIAPVGICEAFLDALAPGLRRLARAGVELELRRHPNEDRERYRRLLLAHGLDIPIAPDGPFAAAAASTELLISAASSVAFEAAALGLPVLMWLGGTPARVRAEHLLEPWTDGSPGTFEDAEGFLALAERLIEHPADGFEPAHALARRLAGYAEPFRPDRFLAGLHTLAAGSACAPARGDRDAAASMFDSANEF